jgi:hypothetical protein
VSHDASGGQAVSAEPFLQPTVSWSAEMSLGRRYLVTVDLALVNDDGTPADWPFEDEEEYTYTCLVDGGGVFELWAVHDASVVLHRFGGSYGPAEFVVTPSELKPGGRSIWLTVLNQWGISVGDYELPVEVRAATGVVRGQVDVPAGLSPGRSGPQEQAGELDPDLAQEFSDILADSDHDTVDIPYRDVAGVLPYGDAPVIVGAADEELAVRPRETPPATTSTDLPQLDATDRDLAQVLDFTRSDWQAERYAEPSPPRERSTARLTERLSEHYNLAGLRRTPSGRLNADMISLFPPGSARGSRVTFTAHCATSDERGTVFTVVASSGDGSDRRAEPRSIQSAKIPPGTYRVTAELLPGRPHVRFDGLPAQLREDPRQWREIVATVPRRLPTSGGPAHLVVAIEISAPDGRIVHQRLDAARRLIEYVAAESTDLVCYSVAVYGPHRLHLGNPEYPEVQARTLAWAVAADGALDQLDQLSASGPAEFGYERAAQLECMLTDLEGQLTGQEGRPVIVTAGARPPHPPRVDPGTGIIPCFRRNDWKIPLTQLQARFAGIKFGAIRETAPTDELWRQLGASAVAIDGLLVPSFAQSLGLTSLVPLPSVPPIALPLFAG